MDNRPFQVRVIVNYLTAFFMDKPIKCNPFDTYSNRSLGLMNYIILKNYKEEKIVPKLTQYFWLLISLKRNLHLKGKFYSE